MIHMSKFNASKVVRRQSRGFVEGDYNLEVVEAKAQANANTGTQEVVVQFKIVGSTVGYNNARVFEHLYFADKRNSEEGQNAFEVSVNKMLDMGVEATTIDANTLKAAAAQAADLIVEGMITRARLYEDLTTGRSQYKVRRFITVG